MHRRPSLGARCRSTCDRLVGLRRVINSSATFFSNSFVRHIHSITVVQASRRNVSSTDDAEHCCLANLCHDASSARARVLALVYRAGSSPSLSAEAVLLLFSLLLAICAAPLWRLARTLHFQRSALVTSQAFTSNFRKLALESQQRDTGQREIMDV
jgi:hypothetical protein